jgi:hypothetical protein
MTDEDRQQQLRENVGLSGALDARTAEWFSVDEMKIDDVLQFLRPNVNLPPPLFAMACDFARMARHVITVCPRCPQRTLALNSLLDAKDRAVRALLPRPEGL